MSQRPLPRSGASIFGDYPAVWDLEPSVPVRLATYPCLVCGHPIGVIGVCSICQDHPPAPAGRAGNEVTP